MITVSNIKAVDKAILSIHQGRTVCATLKMIAEKYGSGFKLALANSGDQNNDTIPERPVCAEIGNALIRGLCEKYNRIVGY